MKIDASITEKLTQNARTSLAHAHKIALLSRASQIAPEHMLYSIFLQRGCAGALILRNSGCTKKSFESALSVAREDKDEPVKKNTLTLHSTLSKCITDAYATASQFGYPYVGTEHITHAILHEQTDIIQEVMRTAQRKSDPEKLQKKLSRNTPQSSPHTPQDVLSHIGHILGHDGLAFLGAGTEGDDNIIEQFTSDASHHGKKNIFVGYEDVCARVTTVLGRRTKNNPLLVGDPGVGKTALIEHLAHLATTADAPAHLHGKRILTLDLALIVAGTSFRGEFEQRLKEVIAEAQNDPMLILFIDEIHTMIGTGNTGGSLDVANILKPALARGDISIIGATTHDEYKKHIEKDAALSRRFQKITLQEPSADTVRKIIQNASPLFSDHHHVTFSPSSIDALVTMSARYITNNHFPDKAFDVLDETASRLRNKRTHHVLEEELITAQNSHQKLKDQKDELLADHHYDAASTAQKKETASENCIHKLEQQLLKLRESDRPIVRIEDIANTIAEMAHIPRDVILESPQQRILRAEKNLSRSIIGQQLAITEITQTLIKSALGISDPLRPRGSFLLAGPTGVGKTLTAEILARDIYGNDDSLIRIDMSEFSERHTVSRLLGAPAGYVGYGEGSTIVEKVRQRPYSIILFDEIEKAHPDTLKILLQILESGTLTDNEGRTANFCHSIIILTSNVGARLDGATSLGFDAESGNATHFKNSLHGAFAPEFIARLDHVITYNTLSEKDLRKIARIHLKKLVLRLKEKEISLEMSSEVVNHIASHAHVLHGGARAVRSMIHNDVESQVAICAIDNVKDITLSVVDSRIVASQS